MATTYSIWTRDSLNGWNKGAALYTDRIEASKMAVSCVDKLIYQGGTYSSCTDIRVFPSAMPRAEVLSRVALAA